MDNQLGSLILIPVPLAENALHTLPSEISMYCKKLKYFFVENVRESRRFLKQIDASIDIDKLHFSETNKNTLLDKNLCKQWLLEGKDVGVMSDAGCPGIADPGAELCGMAQEMGAKVIPLVGPNSILLVLMASGLNGQNFAFNGYLPQKDPERSKKIKAVELHSSKEKQSQVFIETPYRNNALLQDFLKNCSPKTMLCIGLNVTSNEEKIITKSIDEWKKVNINLPKQPAIFILQG
jgi:16S rRNA (cytidine1402-2'-O)-methyltransferase